jgi:hypothetical protein
MVQEMLARITCALDIIKSSRQGSAYWGEVMRNAIRHLMCTLGLAGLAIAAPAGATVIASFNFSGYGIGFGGSGDAKVFAPLFSVSVNGAPDFSAVPVNGNNVFELSGSSLTTMATELSDGTPDAYRFKLVLDSVNDNFSLTLMITETSFTGAAGLPGASIQGIRISLIDLCMQPTTAGGCAFPGPGFVGFNSDLLIEISDTPFGVPEPASLALLGLGLAGLAASLRRKQ